MNKKNNTSAQNSVESIKEVLNEKSPLELINELDAKMADMTEYDCDVELVKLYLDILQQKAPVMEDFDEEQAFQDFLERCSLFSDIEITDPPKRRISPRFIRVASTIAVAACLIFTILLVPTDAYGNSFMDRIIHWGEEVLSIRRLPPGGVMTLPADSGAEYRSLTDALEKNGISAANCPTWIPAGFALEKVSFAKIDTLKTIIAAYQNDEYTIRLTVQYYMDTSSVISLEKDQGGIVYSTKGQEYYILENMGVSNAVWADDYTSYQIFGDIPIDDLKIMIDSIKER